MMKTLTRRLMGKWALGALVLGFSLSSVSAAEPSPVYELRTYKTQPGKLTDLLKRFENHTLALFEKHGMKNLGYWVPTEEKDGASDTLIYVLEHESRDAAKASWQAFVQDPEWKAAAEASEKNGKILASAPESVFMKSTQYSPKFPQEVKSPARTFQLRVYKTEPGKLDALHERFAKHTLGLFARHGMENLCYWTPTDEKDGASNTLIYLLAHPSQEAAKASFDAFRVDPEWKAVKAESEAKGSLTLKGGVTGVFLKPVNFSKLQ